MEFSRKCPDCNELIFYKTKKSFDVGIVKNTFCRKCIFKGNRSCRYGVKLTEEQRKISSVSWFKKGHRPLIADLHKDRTIEDIYGYDRANVIRKKRSDGLLEAYKQVERRDYKRECYYNRNMQDVNIGRKHSEETKRKQRLRTIERLFSINGNYHPPYNEKACQYFDKLMMETDSYIQHALNGGEYHILDLGYWVDGYDKDHNIVYEFDEKNHYRDGELLEKDKFRQKEIEEFLKCKFIRIKETDII